LGMRKEGTKLLLQPVHKFTTVFLGVRQLLPAREKEKHTPLRRKEEEGGLAPDAADPFRKLYVQSHLY